MSRLLSWSVLRNIGLLILLTAASIGVVGYLRWAIRVDPFARFRPSGDQNRPDQVAVQLKDVSLWNWDEGKLVLSCDLGRIDIHRDRQHLNFYEVSNGVYRGEKSNFHFSGPKADYDAGSRNFRVQQGGRAWNGDLDLKAEALEYSQPRGLLRTRGSVAGRLFDGQAMAMNVLYYPETRMFEAGPISWEGKLPKSFQSEAGTDVSKPWKIKASHVKSLGDVQYYDEGEATDGEIIVKAPKLERNTKTDVLTATGKVEYYSKKANLICEKAVVYRKEKRAVLTGNVTMLVKPEDQEKLEVVEIEPFRPMVPEDIAASRPQPPTDRSAEDKKQDDELRSSKNSRKYPISIRSEKIEYWYRRGDRHAIITGNPQARQDFPNNRWRRMWTNKAYYDAEKETLRLESSEGKKDTRVITSLGDDLIATTFLTSTKNNDIQDYEGKDIEGTVISDDEDINRRNNPPATNNRPPRGLRGNIGRGRT